MPTEKIVKNIVGPGEDDIVEQTTKKTLYKKGQATTPDEILDNII